MIYNYPDYFQTFQCIADKCPDTCCAGWYIMIDEDSLEKYSEYEGEYKDTLHKNIKWKDECFRQGKSGNCAFLRDDLLCDMYVHMGESSLCKTCREYPRHTEEFENVREISLSVSCPVVAELLSKCKEKVTFFSEEKDEEEEFFEDYDNFLFEILCDIRSEMLSVLQNREIAMGVRIEMVLRLASLAQARYEEGELALWEDDLEAVKEVAAEENVVSDIWKITQNSGNEQSLAALDYNTLYDYFCFLYELEEINPDWKIYLADVEEVLFGEGEKEFLERKNLFDGWWKESKLLPMEILMEQMAVYFLWIYLPGAVYDERIQGKVRASIGHCLEIYFLLMAEWLMHGGELQQEDLTAVLYSYSREIEHSDYNLELVEEFEWFS